MYLAKGAQRALATTFVLLGGLAMVNIVWPDTNWADATPLEIVRMVVAILAACSSLAVAWSFWRPTRGWPKV